MVQRRTHGHPETTERAALPGRLSGARIAYMDGLRGVAILLVLVNHFAAGVEPHDRGFSSSWSGHGGGLMGVQIFFVLSGYLITSLLIGERDRAGRIGLGAFYLRRFRRLMPALVVLCLGYAAYALAFERDQLGQAFGAILKAITYTGNLPMPWPNNHALTHTWSLAVEEQFYLAWPLCLIVLLRRHRDAAFWFAVSVALATVVVREAVPLVIHDNVFAYGVQYNGLRWDALMVGAALALRPIRVPAWLGWVGVVVTLAVVAFTPDDEFGGWLFTVSTVASLLVVATMDRLPGLSVRWLVYVGRISYSLYLWHVVVERPGLPWPVALVLSFVAAALSYHLVEQWLTDGLFRRTRAAQPSPAVPSPGEVAGAQRSHI